MALARRTSCGAPILLLRTASPLLPTVFLGLDPRTHAEPAPVEAPMDPRVKPGEDPEWR
jgi:hypothetical protein